jgi:hypothetical protein
MWWIWVSFSMNAPCIRVCFSIFPIRELPHSLPPPTPPNGKIGWIYCRIAHFCKIFLNVLSKIDQNFWEKKETTTLYGKKSYSFQVGLWWIFVSRKITAKWTGLHFHKTFCLLLQIPVPAS